MFESVERNNLIVNYEIQILENDLKMPIRFNINNNNNSQCETMNKRCCFRLFGNIFDNSITNCCSEFIWLSFYSI